MVDASVDIKTIRESYPDLTLGELVKDYIVSEFASAFGDAQYKSVNNLSYIIIPCGDGKIKENGYNPFILFNANESTLVLKNSNTVYVRIGMIDMNSGKKEEISELGYSMFYENSSGGNTTTSINFNTYNTLSVRVLPINSTSYHFSVYPGAIPLVGSLNTIVTKTKSVIDDAENDAVIVMPYGVGNRRLYEVYTYNNTIYYDHIYRWELPTRSTVANVYQFNNGLVYVDDVYLCFPNTHTILQSLVPLNKSSPIGMWSDKVTIGGKKFSLHINAGNGDSNNMGSSSITIALLED